MIDTEAQEWKELAEFRSLKIAQLLKERDLAWSARGLPTVAACLGEPASMARLGHKLRRLQESHGKYRLALEGLMESLRVTHCLGGRCGGKTTLHRAWWVARDLLDGMKRPEDSHVHDAERYYLGGLAPSHWRTVTQPILPPHIRDTRDEVIADAKKENAELLESRRQAHSLAAALGEQIAELKRGLVGWKGEAQHWEQSYRRLMATIR